MIASSNSLTRWDDFNPAFRDTWKQTMRERAFRLLAGSRFKRPPRDRVEIVQTAFKYADSFSDADGRLFRPVYWVTLNPCLSPMPDGKLLGLLHQFVCMTNREYFGQRFEKYIPPEERAKAPYFFVHPADSSVRFPHVHALVEIPVASYRKGPEDFPVVASGIGRRLFPGGQVFVGGEDAPGEPVRTSADFARLASYGVKPRFEATRP